MRMLVIPRFRKLLRTASCLLPGNEERKLISELTLAIIYCSSCFSLSFSHIWNAVLPQEDLFIRVYFKSSFLILASQSAIISKNLVILVCKIWLGANHHQAHKHTYRLIDTESNRFTLIPADYFSGMPRLLHSTTQGKKQTRI